MTKKNYTHIEILLDESGSMHTIKDATLEGYNSFLLAQKQAPGQASIGLSKFSKIESYNWRETPEIVRNWYSHADIRTAPELKSKDFIPDGTTPLYDAVCRTIDNTGKWLSNMAEDMRPDKVLFVIITDGLENASVIYTAQDVKERITKQTDRYNWQFVYLGANQDAILVGSDMGIAKASSMTYRADYGGTKSAYAAITTQTVNYRAGGNFGFTDEDREEQE